MDWSWLNHSLATVVNPLLKELNLRLKAADDLILGFYPVLKVTNIGLTLRKLLCQLDAVLFSLLALGCLLLTKIDSLTQLLLQTGCLLFQTKDFLAQALSHFMWHFRAFLKASRIYLVLLILLIIAEVFLVD